MSNIKYEWLAMFDFVEGYVSNCLCSGGITDKTVLSALASFVAHRRKMTRLREKLTLKGRGETVAGMTFRHLELHIPAAVTSKSQEVLTAKLSLFPT